MFTVAARITEYLAVKATISSHMAINHILILLKSINCVLIGVTVMLVSYST